MPCRGLGAIASFEINFPEPSTIGRLSDVLFESCFGAASYVQKVEEINSRAFGVAFELAACRYTIGVLNSRAFLSCVLDFYFSE